ncbi:hypothetical protein M9H61_02405 [Thalassospira sp. GO-4]|jgi:hypothetical protein|uniref:hypothetical protein n=1 Tax=Thalassospira sp. GO-4 TaxID=2946605 RepID=UPI0020255999|nr:hypothetical protein [Thalassospira sp. GO-4]URK18382.1 hypothetical protein M9H61_02405 [Thalassospira sp. GO-4]
MMRDETGQEDRRPVYLPENRHHWASNDEVDKPVVDLSRGPVRARFKHKAASQPPMSPGEWMRRKLPHIGATAIVAIVIGGVVLATFTDLASIVLR